MAILNKLCIFAPLCEPKNSKNIATIIPIQHLSNPDWNAFVQNHPDGNVFHTADYFHALQHSEKVKAYGFAAMESDCIKGIFLFAIHKEAYGIVPSRFTARAIAMAAPLISDNDTSIAEILLEASNILIKDKCIYLEIRNVAEEYAFLSTFEKAHYSVQSHLNIILSLNTTFDDLQKAFVPAAKNKVRKAARKGVSVRQLTSEQEIEQAYAVLNSVYKRIHLPLLPKDVFVSAVKDMSNCEKVILLAAFIDELPVSVMLVSLHHNTAYSWYMGSLKKYKSYSPTDLLVAETLHLLQQKGFTQFNWGGAGQANIPYGVRDFKLKFGGELVNEYRLLKVYKPVIYRLGRAVVGFLVKKIR